MKLQNESKDVLVLVLPWTDFQLVTYKTVSCVETLGFLLKFKLRKSFLLHIIILRVCFIFSKGQAQIPPLLY